jgi:hypothetical protein
MFFFGVTTRLSCGCAQRRSLVLLNREVGRVMLQQQRFIAGVKSAYCDPEETAKQGKTVVSFSRVMVMLTVLPVCSANSSGRLQVPFFYLLTQDFKIVPQLCSVDDAKKIFDAVNASEE